MGDGWVFPTYPDPYWEAMEESRRDKEAEKEERERLRDLYGAHAFRSRRTQSRGKP